MDILENIKVFASAGIRYPDLPARN